MDKLLEIVEGISQILTTTHDAPSGQGGPSKPIGLMREKEVTMYETRTMDGFGVQFHGNMITIKYQAEVPLQLIHDKNFETDMRAIMKKISSYIKDEFKQLKKKNLKLTEYGDFKVMVQTTNRVKAIINTAQTYELSDVKSEDDNRAVLAQLTKNWLQKSKE